MTNTQPMPAPDLPAEVTPLESFLTTTARLPSHPFIRYFDRTLTFAEVDRLSTALAAALRVRGVTRGNRIALFLQNDPDFAIAQLAGWKAGAVCVSINPMLRGQELEHILVDSGATALVALDGLWQEVAREIVDHTPVHTVLVTGPDDWTGQNPAPAPSAGAVEGICVESLRTVVREHADAEAQHEFGALDDVALICYTSGTSGRPKGVAATHRNVAYSAEVYRTWMSIDENDVFLGGAPIFHVTGLIAGLALAYRSGMSLVLFHRFEPGVCIEEIATHRPTFTIMATTAFQALVNHPNAHRSTLASLTKVYSGGAPVTAAIDQQWRRLTGRGIRNVYGLTETTGPTHAVPLDGDGPIDAESGAMSVGLPLPGVEARLVSAESGVDVQPGEQGELWIKGPMVMKGYWGLPEATTQAFHDGYFRTGDVATRDHDGWFFVIDRLKDMINASGYKVWPREVEEFLLQHPDIREAAVVGVADAYRGESVKAFVVLRAGSRLNPDDVIAFAKTRMAAYKYPRHVELVDSLPKTASGKILRRELRTVHTATR
ncbi:MAG TPA: AMP-binding protein [Amycolatopsis sp.]|uniref:class I adenylate-forming enzyme family protein n=1 Tax=Amycolatopsis sp. TaxID=37632 RepID=UPI002B495B0F|nr:AMP-binding protein [Amycolatopsis sp.]HKS46992.1 AMP-binding protein [Amycolatopsis sp.]